MTSTTNLAVVVVHYRTPHLLARCLEALRGYPEVVVVDNASGCDDTARVVNRFEGVALVAAENNRGFGAGANVGLRATRGDPVLLLNPDCVVTEGFASRLVGAVTAHPRLWVAGCRLEAPDGAPRLSGRRWYTPASMAARRLAPRTAPSRRHVIDGWDRMSDRTVDWVTGTGMVVTRRALGELDGFDERYFMYFEDVDLCLRAWEAGGEVWYLAGPRLKHDEARASARGLNRALFWHLRAYARFLRKWGRRGLRPPPYGDLAPILRP